MTARRETWDEPVYLDTSALVKLLVPEADSDALNDQLTGLTSVAISDLTITEAASALARRVRDGRLTSTTARRLHREAVRLQAASQCVELTPPIHRRAEHLLLTLAVPLRPLDALHVASALESHAATLVTFDDRLATAATTVGLRVPQFE